MKKGDLLEHRSSSGEFAIIIRNPFTKFFPDEHHCDAFDSGVAATAIRIKWIQSGYEKTYKLSSIRRNWKVINENR